jgi:hypothetical protein
VVVLVNIRPQPVTVTVDGPSIDGARDLLDGRVQRGQTVSLGAYGTAVLEPGH